MDNLTRSEAQERARLVSEVEYDVRLDLTGSTTGRETFECRATVRFRCHMPGAATFIDFLASSVQTAVLNGKDLPGDTFDGKRIRLAGLETENELRVMATCGYERTGMGLHSFQDPADGRVYLYTQFETFAAHHVYPCFDQPDLKATFTFAVRAPAGFQVVSNSPVVKKGSEAQSEEWTFETTPLLPTYVTAIVAGPYHSVFDSYRTVDLGLYCRQSLVPYLDSDELFTITKQGFAFFEEAFGYPYPFETYNQMFVPEFRFGAMENAGCITLADTAFLFRSKVTDSRRLNRAMVILHEMAHMWFGDLVTMRWWDDLWLNESFATIMGYFAAARATRFTNAWINFAVEEKTWAYRQDQLPTTHPIAADIPDIESVDLYFDGISYAKGAAVLRQLIARVGEDPFWRGLRSYFHRHQYGNTDLTDFLGAMEEVAPIGDLRAWAQEWLETAGVNTLHAEFTLTDSSGRAGASAPSAEASATSHFQTFAVIQEAPRDWPTLRSHRFAIGFYDATPSGLVCRRRVDLGIDGALTRMWELIGERMPALVLLNDGDLTYAKIRLDPASLATVTHHLKDLRDDLARALCWSATWEAVRDGALAARDYRSIVLNNIQGEGEIGTVERLLTQVRSAILVYGDPTNRDAANALVATTALAALRGASPGTDFQLAWARAFVASARSPGDLAIVRSLLDGHARFDGLAVDTDLRWHVVRSLTAVDAGDETLAEAELERDPTDAGHRQAAAARAGIPTAEAKASAWKTIVEDRSKGLATARAWMSGFQSYDQATLLEPYVPQYFDAIGRAWHERGPEFGLAFTQQMYPRAVVDNAVVRATDEYLASSAASPAIRRLLLEGRDDVLRAQRARAIDVGPILAQSGR